MEGKLNNLSFAESVTLINNKPLMANAFMCNIEKQLETENKMPAFYKRYVDDTLSAMPDFETEPLSS